MTIKTTIKFTIFGLLLPATLVHAKLVEEVITVPVTVKDMYGKVHTQSVQALVFFDDEKTNPYPVAVLGHGRSANPAQRLNQNLYSGYASTAKWLVSWGFIVAVPERIGYGKTGGDDLDDSGRCSNKNYTPVYDAAASQMQQILNAMRQRQDVSKDKGLLLGQSFGGATVIALAAQNPNGVQAVVNLAGGGGGNPDTSPREPCRPDSLKQMFSTYGETARIPSLWIYTENDQYWGAQYPKDWFAAFKAKGGVGEFLFLPPNGKDGHSTFYRDPKAWRPQVLDFLKAQGLVKK